MIIDSTIAKCGACCFRSMTDNAFTFYFADIMKKKQTTRKASSQTIHIRHNYRTSSHSSSLHNQSSRPSDCATLKQNDCTSSNFSVTLRA